MRKTGPAFRLFVSSTFADMRRERDLLQREVFPRLADLSRSLGADFRVIDLRWGIPDEASQRHSVADMCLAEVEEALKAEVEPRLLYLLGQRYGWRPLPPWIVPAHLEQLARASARSGDSRIDADTLDLFRRWYVADENAVPAHLTLQPADDLAKSEWRIVERRLRAALDAISPGDDWLDAHSRSLSEREMRRGLERGEKAFAVLRTLSDLGDAPPEQRDNLVGDDPVTEARQEALRERVRSGLPRSHVLEIATGWQTSDPRTAAPVYDATLAESVFGWLSREVRGALHNYNASRTAHTETGRHFGVARRRAWKFVERQADFDVLIEAIKSAPDTPIIVDGAAGSGKSTLVARVWTTLASGATTILARFAGESGEGDPRSLMYGLLRELQLQTRQTVETPATESVAISVFRRSLAEAGAHGSVLVLFDEVEEFPGLAKTLVRWLPHRLPQGAGVVISLREGSDLQIMQRAWPAATRVSLDTLSMDVGGALLDRWLSEVGRTLRPNQRSSIVSAFGQNGTPLWLSIAFERARSWQSFDSPIALPASVDGLIGDQVIARLLAPPNHLGDFSLRALALIAGSRHGITENELIDCLSANDDFWAAFDAGQRWTPPLRRVPDAMWGRLKADLAPYLADGGSSSDALIRFKHAVFETYVREQLPAVGSVKDPHGVLADFFLEQPLYFGSGDNPEPNQRKLSELPYQLVRSGRVDALIELLLSDGSWRQARLASAGDDRGFIADLDIALDALPQVPTASAVATAARLAIARWRSDALRLNLTDDDLKLMVWIGNEERALGLAEEQEDEGSAARALTSIAEAIADMAGAVDPDALSRAERAAEALQDPWARILLLVRLIVTYVRVGHRDRAAGLIVRLGTLTGANAGNEQQRGVLIRELVERLALLGDIDLAERAATLAPADAVFWNGPEAVGLLARAQAASGMIDDALAAAERWRHSRFDHGVIFKYVLSGAAECGSQALATAAAALEVDAILPDQRYGFALILEDHEDALRRVLEPVFRLARMLVPELDALQRQLAAAKNTSTPHPFRFDRLDWSLPPEPPSEEALRYSDLNNRARELRLSEFCYFALKLHEPWADQMLALAPSLIDGDLDAQVRFLSEYGAAIGISSDLGAAVPIFRDAARMAIAAGEQYAHLKSLQARTRMLSGVARCYLRVSHQVCRPLIASLNDRHERAGMCLGFLALGERLSDGQRDEIRSCLRADLPDVVSLDHLRAIGQAIDARHNHELAVAVLDRIEDVLSAKANPGPDRTRDSVAVLTLEGVARLDPSQALQDVMAGKYGTSFDAVAWLAAFLARRTEDRGAPEPFIAAARLARERGTDVSLPGHDVLSGLLQIGATDEAILLSKRLLAPHGAANSSHAFDVIRAFATSRSEALLPQAFEGASAVPVVFWLYQVVLQSRSGSRDALLTPEQLAELAEGYSVEDICELGLAALELGMTAAPDILALAISKADSTSEKGMYQDGMRSLALKSLVARFSDRGALDFAAQAFERMRSSGGDGSNHPDWTQAVADIGVAQCRAGNIQEALQLIASLNRFDADERETVSHVRRAASAALFKSGRAAEAQEQIALIPDVRVRRAAQAEIVRDYARRSDYKSAFRHIRFERITQCVHLGVDVLNVLVEQNAVTTIEDYHAIVEAFCTG